MSQGRQVKSEIKNEMNAVKSPKWSRKKTDTGFHKAWLAEKKIVRENITVFVALSKHYLCHSNITFVKKSGERNTFR